MPNILEAADKAAKAEALKAALDNAPKRKGRLDFDDAGNIEGSLNVSRQFKRVNLSFTGYLKALVKGPQKSFTAGGRIEADF